MSTLLYPAPHTHWSLASDTDDDMAAAMRTQVSSSSPARPPAPIASISSIFSMGHGSKCRFCYFRAGRGRR